MEHASPPKINNFKFGRVDFGGSKNESKVGTVDNMEMLLEDSIDDSLNYLDLFMKWK